MNKELVKLAFALGWVDGMRSMRKSAATSDRLSGEEARKIVESLQAVSPERADMARAILSKLIQPETLTTTPAPTLRVLRNVLEQIKDTTTTLPEDVITPARVERLIKAISAPKLPSGVGFTLKQFVKNLFTMPVHERLRVLSDWLKGYK